MLTYLYSLSLVILLMFADLIVYLKLCNRNARQFHPYIVCVIYFVCYKIILK